MWRPAHARRRARAVAGFERDETFPTLVTPQQELVRELPSIIELYLLFAVLFGLILWMFDVGAILLVPVCLVLAAAVLIPGVVVKARLTGRSSRPPTSS